MRGAWLFLGGAVLCVSGGFNGSPALWVAGVYIMFAGLSR